MIGLDTTVIIDICNGDEKAIKKMNSLNETLVSTIINYQEIFFGIDLEGLRFLEEEQIYDGFFNNLQLLELTKSSAKKASNIFWKLKSKGQEKTSFDCVIAGILLTNGVNKILTRNTKPFENIPNLEIIGY